MSNHEDRIWRAMADPIRRQILEELARSTQTTGQIVEKLESLSRTAVMKHLEILTRAGLVTVQRQGRNRWNTLNPAPLQLVLGKWRNQHLLHLTASIQRLKGITELGSDDEEPQTSRASKSGFRNTRKKTKGRS